MTKSASLNPPQAAELTTPGQSLVRLTEIVSNLFHRCQVALPEKHRKALGRPEIGVLLAAHPEPIAISDIARRLGVSRQAAHVAVQKLHQAGLVKFSKKPEDARAVLVSANRAGLAIARLLNQALDEALEAEPIFKHSSRRITTKTKM